MSAGLRARLLAKAEALEDLLRPETLALLREAAAALDGQEDALLSALRGLEQRWRDRIQGENHCELVGYIGALVEAADELSALLPSPPATSGSTQVKTLGLPGTTGRGNAGA